MVIYEVFTERVLSLLKLNWGVRFLVNISAPLPAPHLLSGTLPIIFWTDFRFYLL